MPTSQPRKKPALSAQVEKAAALTLATEVLASRVAALADAVQTNNHKIDRLQDEVNKKPDDAEVHFITGMARDERQRHLKYALLTGVASAVVAGGIAYTLGEMSTQRQISERNQVAYSACVATNERTQISSGVFRGVAQHVPEGPAKDRVLQGASVLETTLRDCESLYPKDER